MHIEPSDDNNWKPGPRGRPGEDPQGTAFVEWFDYTLPELIQEWPRRVDVAGAKSLVAKMLADHPGMDVRVRIGGLGGPETAGVYRRESREIVLPSAEEDVEFAMSMGATRVTGEKLETYDTVMVMSLFAHALVHATYDQGAPDGVEPHGPEFVGAFAYIVGRYLVDGESTSIRAVLQGWLSRACGTPLNVDPRLLSAAVDAGLRLASVEADLTNSLLAEGLRVRSFLPSDWRLPE